jgi:hypothetical protein
MDPHHQHQHQHGGDEPGKGREGHMQPEYGSQQPNPDFSQLLD